MAILFPILVILGFVFWFLATFAISPGAPRMFSMERLARGCFLAAAIVWAIPGLTGGH
jgi:hypothetical protein